MERRMIDVDCGRCGGCGELDAGGAPCPACRGKGYVKMPDPNVALGVIEDLASALTDEGPCWSQEGLNRLRERTANIFPDGQCPDWLTEYRTV